MKIDIKNVRGESWKLSNVFFHSAFCDSLCKQPSPYFSVFFISKGITPNTVTLLMIVSGIIAGVFFTIPHLVAKIFAIVLYWLWYIFDCSDGEVARYTNTFSKYGRELDWVAHLSCHSLFVLSVYISYYQLGLCDSIMMPLFTILLISAELISRNLIAFDAFLFSNKRFQEERHRNNIVRFIFLQLFSFPTFVLFFPFFIIIDIWLNCSFSIYVYIIWGTCLCLYSIKEFLRYIVYFYRN